MFLNKVLETKKTFVEKVIELHKKHLIQPDSYVIDVNTFENNARKIYESAQKKNIRLFFMLKQVGRNPYLAKKLIEIGYAGAVCVDFREALLMKKHNIPIGNVGHLVQVPDSLLPQLIEYGCEVMTVFSLEKLHQINEVSKQLNKVQQVIVKVYDDNDVLYASQEGGVHIKSFKNFVTQTKQYQNIQIVGVTAFPCFLFDAKLNAISKTNNYTTVYRAVKILKELGIESKVINLPSANDVSVIEMLQDTKNVVLEPGHALSGTTPNHVFDREELPCVVYVSEISHHYNNQSYCYGGGYYRRSHVKNALINNQIYDVVSLDNDAIDYYFKIKGLHKVGETVIMSFRFQIFVCRSRVVLLENNEIVGEYDALGEVIHE